MNTTCDLVVERVALGEPLGDLAEHAASCARCRRLAALPVELGKASQAADPGLGFAARMTAGTQHRLTVRRRRRIAAGVTAMVAAGALGVLFVTRTPEPGSVATAPARHDQPATDTKPHPKDPWDHHDRQIDPDVAALVHLANVERSSHLSARWGRIEKPVAPYRALLKGITP